MNEIDRLRAQAEKARRFALTVDEKTRQALKDYARECDQKADDLAGASMTCSERRAGGGGRLS